jgi:hypothetical protein
MTDNTNVSDDDLQGDDINPMTVMENDEKLPEDNSTPFSNPDEPHSNAPIDHPQTDSNVDSTQAYNEGTTPAAETSEP